MIRTSYDVWWQGKGYDGASWAQRYPETSIEGARKMKKELIEKAGGICWIEKVVTLRIVVK